MQQGKTRVSRHARRYRCRWRLLLPLEMLQVQAANYNFDT